MAAQLILQAGILILALAIFCTIHYLPKRALAKRHRTKNRASIQTNRHLLQASNYLSRAKAVTTADKNLAKSALTQAEAAIAISTTKDTAKAHVIKAFALDILGHRATALRSLDHALSPPCVRSLEDRERAEALAKRAELKVEVNRRRRMDSAIEDLEEAVRLCRRGGGGEEKVFCLLGECYEFKGLKEKALWAYREALAVEPESVSAREGLGRVGP